MEYYPLYLNLKNRKVLVVGGGNVALRKVKRLLKSGAFITLISQHLNDGFEELKGIDGFRFIKKMVEDCDIKNFDLVFSATDNKEVNLMVAAKAKQEKILCNIADDTKISDFIVPSSIKRGDLMLSVSTSGKSPALSRKLRKDLEKTFGDEYEIFLYFLGQIRLAVLENYRGNPENKNLFRDMVYGDLLLSIKERDIESIESELQTILGDKRLSADLVDKLLEEKHNYFFDVEKNDG